MRYVMGADIGTTRAKCLVFDESGKMVASAWRDYPIVRGNGGFSEQDAARWWSAFADSSREAIARAGGVRVEALCLATQGGTMVPVGLNGEPLSLAAVWNDARCEAQAERFIREVGERAVWEKTGWTLTRGLNALQIAWLRDNRPEVFSRAALFLSVPSYMSMRLTGQPAVDLSNAGIEQLIDIASGAYDGALLRAAAVTTDRLAPLARSGEVIGGITADAARDAGLPEGALVAAGAHDQYLCALGAGALNGGDVYVGTGTAWVVASLSTMRPVRHNVSRSAIDGLWGALDSMESGGESLDWARGFAPGATGMDYDTVNRLAGEVAAGCGGLTFFPYLTGRGHPTPVPEARAAFTGLSARHGTGDMLRAVMEGVCLQLKWMLDDFPVGDGSLAVTGGATYSKVWTRILADVVGRPIRVPHIADAGCAGAAMLAGVATGVFASVPDAASRILKGDHLVEPGADAARYREISGRYRRNAERLMEMEG